MHINPIGKDGFNYTAKINVLPATLKGGAIIAGGAIAFNLLADKPVTGDIAVGYRKGMHKFFRGISGVKDRDMLDAGAMSLLDGVFILGATIFTGRILPLFKGKKGPTNLDDLDPGKGPQR